MNERITYTVDPEYPDRCAPHIASAGAALRPLSASDVSRVQDFGDEGLPEAPADGELMFSTDADTDLKFPLYHCLLRGGYLFYFSPEDVDEDGGLHAPPLGVVPLRHVTVQYPPGGRRCFREHANTPARTGYEVALVHIPEEEEDAEPARSVVFLVAASLSVREKWASALRERAELDKPTVLKGGGLYKAAASAPPPLSRRFVEEEEEEEDDEDGVEDDDASEGDSYGSEDEDDAEEEEDTKDEDRQEKEQAKVERLPKKAVPQAAASSFRKESSSKTPGGGKGRSEFFKKNSKAPREAKSVRQQVLAISNDEDLAGAVVDFGFADFNEQAWMNEFLQVHNDFDAPGQCRQMEQWQAEMKKSLKGAVLEQYEYFVQASGEMTTMGKEVSSLKSMVETQIDVLKEMKDIDFLGALKEREIDPKDEVMGRDESEQPDALDLTGKRSKGEDDRSYHSEMSSDKHGDGEDEEEDAGAPPIAIPDWIKDADEEISATIREGRYNDAIELVLKSRAEIHELFDKHDRPTAYRLTKAESARLRSLRKKVDKLAKRISSRLEETLRRKNEALKQASKRERSDPHMGGSAIISPCALNDDALYLQLLVKLGCTQEAASAYSIRRSLLLLETLHERPISGSGTVDLVIYSAQLSQSFFSCLANAVEGFLDLFIAGDRRVEDISLGDSSSIQSSSPHLKHVPAGAIASVVLWCDTELTKFAAAFGGTRILANLALSPPPSRVSSTQRILGQEDVNKERKNAIEVATQCIDQAFRYASSNLDTVGLPLTPRLAELLRSRLKGCEAEVADLLEEQWNILTCDWRSPSSSNGSGRIH
jgi:hypothetical protein